MFVGLLLGERNMTDKQLIIHIVALAGLEQWQLDREIVEAINKLIDGKRTCKQIAEELKRVLNLI